MSGLVDPQEVQVADRLELALGRARDGVLLERRRLELGGVCVVEVVGDELASEPVADPVCRWGRTRVSMYRSLFLLVGYVPKLLTQIASPDEHVHAALDDLLKRLQEGARLVAGRDDLGVGSGGTLGVRRLGPDGVHNRLGLRRRLVIGTRAQSISIVALAYLEVGDVGLRGIGVLLAG